MMRTRISIVMSVIALLAAFAGSALAAEGPADVGASVTPHGWTGACNMIPAYLNAGLGNAFLHESVNGWNGKWGAVFQTTGNIESDGCK